MANFNRESFDTENIVENFLENLDMENVNLENLNMELLPCPCGSICEFCFPFTEFQLSPQELSRNVSRSFVQHQEPPIHRPSISGNSYTDSHIFSDATHSRSLTANTDYSQEHDTSFFPEDEPVQLVHEPLSIEWNESGRNQNCPPRYPNALLGSPPDHLQQISITHPNEYTHAILPSPSSQGCEMRPWAFIHPQTTPSFLLPRPPTWPLLVRQKIPCEHENDVDDGSHDRQCPYKYIDDKAGVVNYKRHCRRKHMNRGPFPCPKSDCEQICSRIDNLKVHWAKKHPKLGSYDEYMTKHDLGRQDSANSSSVWSFQGDDGEGMADHVPGAWINHHNTW